MHIDSLAEEVRPLSYAARHWVPRTGENPVSGSTIFRWATRGLLALDGSRVRLETLRVGRVPMTSREALQRFFERLSDAGDRDGNPATSSPAAPRPDTTTRKLQAAGLLKT